MELPAPMEDQVDRSSNEEQPVQRPIEYLYITFSTDITSSRSLADHAQSPQATAGEEATVGPSNGPSLSQFENPLCWTHRRKTFVTWLSCLSTFVTTYTPGAYAAGLPQYRSQWGISTIAVYGGITVFTVCFAVAPMFLASFSELVGRRPLFLAAGVVYVISQLGSGLSTSFAGLLVTRATAGISCSVFSTVVGGVISDIYAADDRNTAMAIFTGAALCGTGIGPMISGIITQHLKWQWIFHVQTITCGIVVVALFIFFPETRGSVLLSRKADALNKWYEFSESTGSDDSTPSTVAETETQPRRRIRWIVKANEERATLGIMMKTSLLRPIKLLLTESVVFWFSLWMSFAWSILYLTFEAVPLIFTRVYGFSPQANGFCFIAVSIASILGTVAALIQERVSRRLSIYGQPEARLVFACVQSLLLPIGLFWLGTTARINIPWIVPVLSICGLTLGIFSIYLAVFNYLADTYHSYASSAIAAQSFTRNIFAACLPLAVEPMLDSLGLVGMGCLLGAVGLALSAVPWVLVLWGPRIRKRSKLLNE